ncbi:MAG: ABC transporter ATP-binding protein [Dehalococcoidia bacterium]
MDAPLTPKLSLRAVIVRRAGRPVLNIPSLDVPTGRVLSVIGPNGAGKTTLLLTLALLERPTQGTVLFEGARTTGQALALRRRMAVVFQEPLLLDRTVQANVETGLALRGVSRGDRHGRARTWLERFGMGPFAARSSRTLSGGEAQRVSLARAFALEPEVLLLDEPFSALDQPTREALTEDLSNALRQTRVTAVLVTHDRDEAARLGDDVVVLIRGELRQSGPPESVFGAPVDAEVAAFVGVETVLPASVVERREGLMTLDAGGYLVEAVDDRAFEQALVCLRPEDVTLSPAAGAATSARNHIPGRVRRVVLTGADARVELDCGVTLVARITRRSLEDLGLREGDDAVATFKATAVHLIPRQ